MTSRDASLATRRFGLGPRQGDLRRIAGDPRGYVLAALADPSAARITDPQLRPSHDTLSELRDARKDRRLARKAVAVPASDESRQSMAGEAGAAAPQTRADGRTPKNPIADLRRDTFRAEAAARLERARTTDAPFLERLVMFWSSHFTVSALKGGALVVTAGAYEREAIRPHVLGRFADMLKAVAQHPAMLIYLDNAQSFGPGSRAGQRRKRGLNENLAREILELHALGVDGGYSQADVTSLARIITGWSVAPPNGRLGEPGRFVFNANGHEPGAQTVLGKRYEDRGLATGEEVLADLARHPATARHIARKLARHFVGDSPQPALVSLLERTYRDSDGDLGQVARALASAPEAWQARPRKVVPPYDFAVALMRGFDLAPKPQQVVRLAAAIGQPLWRAPSPKGWPEEDGAWMGPSAVRERLRIAEMVALQIKPTLDPRAAAADLLGEAMSAETRQAVARAETRQQGFELLIMSPEFLRR